jgi:hypothetical protein
MSLDFRKIAAELARRYSLLPHAARREAHGWGLQDAGRINACRQNAGLDPGGLAGMTARHLSQGHPRATPSGRRPLLLTVLAAAYNCAVTGLIGFADSEPILITDSQLGQRRGQLA